MKKMNGMKVLSLVVAIGSALFAFASGVIEDKKMDAKIAEKVQKALAESNKEN